MHRKLLVIGSFFLLTVSASGQELVDSFPFFQTIAGSSLTGVVPGKKIMTREHTKPLSLFIFISPECPLCQNYSSVLKKLKTTYDQQVNFYGIVPGTAYTRADITSFTAKYKTGIDFYIDQRKEFTQYLQATVTPQVILLGNDGRMIYNGAIDDWVQATGKKKLRASQHFLEDAILLHLQNSEVKIKKTKAFGCKINDY
jgi:thioredoxin-related protein